MGPGFKGQEANVLRDDVVPPPQPGQRAGHPQDHHPAPRGYPALQKGVRPRPLLQVQDVVQEPVVHADAALNLSLKRHDLVRREQGLEGREVILLRAEAQDSALVLPGGVADGRLDHEAVHLGLRQGEGPRVLDGVLCRDDEEGIGQGVASPVHGHLLLPHGLQEGTLGLGRRAVDLVHQQQVVKYRPRVELELTAVRPVDVHARDVRGQEVVRALHAAEAQAQEARSRQGQRRLAEAGHVLQQEVATREHAHQKPKQHGVLAVQDGRKAVQGLPRPGIFDLDGILAQRKTS